MKLFVVAFAFVMFAMSGCFAASGSLHSGGMTFEASGLNAPSPMEMAASDLMSSEADRNRDEGSCIRSQGEMRGGHPERCPRGYGYSGYGSYGRVDPSYYYPGYPTQTQPPFEERAEELEGQATEFEQRLNVLEGRQP